MSWPGAAAVTVALVHAAGGRPADFASGELDGREARTINSRLRSKPERPDPVAVKANADVSFQGSVVLGMGFTLTPEERAALVAKEPRNGERTFPYLGGVDVNSHPRHETERWVIGFGQLDLAQAEQWPDLLNILREKVKPERDLNTREARKKYWWRFGEPAPALYAAIAPLRRCLVTSLTSKHRVFAFVPTSQILDQKLIVFAVEKDTFFACLQSRIHLAWAELLSSTMKTDLNYTASDCFETFPFPQPSPRAIIATLEEIGQQLYDTRARFMVDTNQGLTKTYNALKDPACDDPHIIELRTLHEGLDRAVLDAYGWPDIQVPPFCPRTQAERALVTAFEDEVIDRLYELNETRAADEARAGLGANAKPTSKSGGKRGAKATPVVDPESSPEGGQGKLF